MIRPSLSPWASPVVLKDSKLRFCMDYRRLNSISQRKTPCIRRYSGYFGEDLLLFIFGFSYRVLAGGVEEESRQKSVFTTHRGLYEFTRMPFGLCNGPATFQQLMTQVLADLEWGICFVYLDDILLVSGTFEEHLQHLGSVFERLRKAGLRLKPRKCLLLRDEVPLPWTCRFQGGDQT